MNQFLKFKAAKDELSVMLITPLKTFYYNDKKFH